MNRPRVLPYSTTNRLGSEGWYRPDRTDVATLHAQMIFFDAVSRLAPDAVRALWDDVRPLVRYAAVVERIKAGLHRGLPAKLGYLPEPAQNAVRAWAEAHHLIPAKSDWTVGWAAAAVVDWLRDGERSELDPLPLVGRSKLFHAAMVDRSDTASAASVTSDFSFQLPAWHIQGTWSDYEEFAKAEFNRKLREYKEKSIEAAEAAGWRSAPQKYGENPAAHFEMLVRWNVLRQPWGTIADEYEIGKVTNYRDKRTGALRTRHSGEKEVKKQARKVASLLGLQLRKGTPGPKKAR